MDKTLTEQEIALLRRKLDLLLRTGQLLVESAADTNRVVRNLNRVAAYLGLPEEKLHIDVSYTMLVVNVSDGLHSFSKFQKCEKHGINMTAIPKSANCPGGLLRMTIPSTSMRRNWKESKQEAELCAIRCCHRCRLCLRRFLQTVRW